MLAEEDVKLYKMNLLLKKYDCDNSKLNDKNQLLSEHYKCEVDKLKNGKLKLNTELKKVIYNLNKIKMSPSSSNN